MKAAGIIGWPVAHSKSPLIHRFWLAKLGLDGDYGRFAVHPDDLGEAIRALPAMGLAGVNVTVPHKVAVMAHLDIVETLASEVGAVNTIVASPDGELLGYNSDVAGIKAALDGIDFFSKSIVIVGAGGAARAAVAAMSGTRHQELLVVARDVQRAVGITRPFDVFGVGVPFDGLASVIRTAEVIINASPLGMRDQPEFDSEVIEALRQNEESPILLDMVYAPLDTELLTAARSRGMRTIDGLHMLVAQAAVAFELFYGAPAPRQHDAELRALLIA